MTRLAMRGVYLLAAGLLFVGCGSSGSSAGTSLKTLPKDVVSTTMVNQATTTTTAPAQTLTMTPAIGITEGQTVQVNAKGFKPNAQLLVLECADKGGSTGAGDCKFDHPQVNADGSGNVSTTYKVTKGPVGSANNMCTATQKCVVSVSEPSANGASASATIAFAG